MFIVGDPSLRYGDIVSVIDAAKGAGVEKGRDRHDGYAQRGQRREVGRAIASSGVLIVLKF